MGAAAARDGGCLQFDAEGEEVECGIVVDGEFVHFYTVSDVNAEQVEQVESYTCAQLVVVVEVEFARDAAEAHHGTGVGTGGENADGFPAGAYVDGYVEVAAFFAFESIDCLREEVAAEGCTVPVSV